MTGPYVLETIVCPYCSSDQHQPWAEEAGFKVVRCGGCRLLYCNPRPSLAAISMAVRTGVHSAEAHHLDVRAHRVAGKVRYYRRALRSLFADIWDRRQPISWLDVGSGYGEVLEAVSALAPAGSSLEGLEPMAAKAARARARGLTIVEDYLRPEHPEVDIMSLVDVFSHIPSFSSFLSDVRSVLTPGGALFVETGNLADLDGREMFPGELGLPDHLVFTGEKQLEGYLNQAGFEVVRVERRRIDGIVNLPKNLVKRALGRPAALTVPYTSKYRSLLVRARLRH